MGVVAAFRNYYFHDILEFPFSLFQLSATSNAKERASLQKMKNQTVRNLFPPERIRQIEIQHCQLKF